MYTFSRPSTQQFLRSAGFFLLAASLLGASGCGSNSAPSNVQVGAITFTDAGGTPQPSLKLLTVGESTNLSVNLADDPQNLGANWSVYCGSAPAPGTPLPPGQTQDQSCGTFSPVHTISGPIPSYSTSPSGYVTLFTAPAAVPKNGTITLYASSTSNPSRSATMTLTIISQYITVQLAPAPPAMLNAGAGAQIAAVVNNDVSNAGVTWSAICAQSDCGSFSPAATASGVATTYTAPATAPSSGGTVQITATSVADPTRAVSATTTVVDAGMAASMETVESAHEAAQVAEIKSFAAIADRTKRKSARSSSEPARKDVASLEGISSLIDAKGTLWIRRKDGSNREFVGGASWAAIANRPRPDGSAPEDAP